MKLPVQITFRNIPSSETVEEWIRAKAEKLETFYERPIACRVAVELPHRHHRRGSTYHVRIELWLPGGQIVVNHIPNVSTGLRHTGTFVLTKRLEPDRANRNLHLAINDGFEAAARQLRDYARRQRGDVKTHAVRRA
jgi:hypothetical protein